MKHLLFLFISCMVAVAGIAQADDKKVYTTNNGEWIFSFADITTASGANPASVVRFTPFFNTQFALHYDPIPYVGLFTGLGIRNVGFIYDQSVPNGATIRKKHRTYNLGIPVALKVGKMDKSYVYGGYEFELPFNYKEKTFVDDSKEKFNEWFSNRVPDFYHTWFVGIQFPKGANLKFKYYLTEFFNRDFTEEVTVDGVTTTVRPYENLQVNTFYISLTFNVFGKGDTGMMGTPGKSDVTSYLY